jgi:hypothetical protein
LSSPAWRSGRVSKPGRKMTTDRGPVSGRCQKDVPRMVRDGGEHRVGLAALHDRVDGQVGRQLPPGSFERFSQPPPGLAGVARLLLGPPPPPSRGSHGARRLEARAMGPSPRRTHGPAGAAWSPP